MMIRLLIATILTLFTTFDVKGEGDAIDKISGIWLTEPYLSQMGNIALRYDFKSNNECIIFMTFLDAKIPELIDKAFCEFKDDTLAIKNKNGVFFHTYTLRDGILTIKEKSGETYRLKRK